MPFPNATGETAMHHRPAQNSDEMLTAVVGVPLKDLDSFMETHARLWAQTGGDARWRLPDGDYDWGGMRAHARMIGRAAKRLIRAPWNRQQPNSTHLLRETPRVSTGLQLLGAAFADFQ